MSVVNTMFHDGVYEIELNRPNGLNALNKELVSAFREAKLNPENRKKLRRSEVNE